ncbi:MAG: hypothetical protein KatS3mg098_387 [Candidatus Parcubacteria bacterium]|nr:MAG: hypothetical protein KatS3mg098_387 [Candidatus Parcubacteria bacterium]
MRKYLFIFLLIILILLVIYFLGGIFSFRYHHKKCPQIVDEFGMPILDFRKKSTFCLIIERAFKLNLILNPETARSIMLKWREFHYNLIKTLK